MLNAQEQNFIVQKAYSDVFNKSASAATSARSVLRDLGEVENVIRETVHLHPHIGGLEQKGNVIGSMIHGTHGHTHHYMRHTGSRMIGKTKEDVQRSILDHISKHHGGVTFNAVGPYHGGAPVHPGTSLVPYHAPPVIAPTGGGFPWGAAALGLAGAGLAGAGLYHMTRPAAHMGLGSRLMHGFNNLHPGAKLGLGAAAIGIPTAALANSYMGYDQ